MQSMWLTTDHLYVLQITLVLMEFASINGFWRLPGTTIGNSMMKDLMDRNIKEKANKKVSCKNIHKCRDGAASH